MSDRKCPRCADCPGNSHHWLDNPDFGADPDDPEFPSEHPTDATHICKHCPVIGDECDECGGDGRGEWVGVDDEGYDEFDNCEVCHGEGVIPRRVESEARP